MTDSNAVIDQAAERYAAALFELADSAGELDSVAADLTALTGALKESAELRRLAQSPLYDAKAKAKALTAVADAAGFSTLTRKFLGMAALNRRADALGDVARAYLDMLARKRGHLRARVTSAALLGEDEIARLKQALRAALGHDVELDAAVDPALLAGLKVRVGSRLFDSSLRAKLEGLRISMKEA